MQRLEQQVTGHAVGPLKSLADHFVQVVETVQQAAGGVTHGQETANQRTRSLTDRFKVLTFSFEGPVCNSTDMKLNRKYSAYVCV